MKISFDTNEYIFSHGKPPRGEGYWALKIVFGNGRGGHSVEEFWKNGKLADVKREAKAFAKANGFGASYATIIIMP